MKKYLSCLFLTSSIFCSTEDIDNKTLSKALGHVVAKNIKNTPASIDEKAFLEGIKESFSGKNAPLSDDDFIAALTKANEKAHKQIATVNLKKAEDFLDKNAKQKDIIDIGDGKLQYRIEHKGKGNAVHSYNTPLVRYTGKYIDGTVFCETLEPERVCLSEAIIGFQKGLEGMKEGEKRTIFVHPSLGYGDKGALLPNSLLTYEVELIKADISQKQIDLQHEKLITSQEQ